MPTRITKEVALERIARESRAPGCLVCSLLASKEARVLERGERATTLLTAYPLTWGHAFVCLHEHVTTYTELSPVALGEATELVHRVATRIEKALAPVRVFVASLGSARNDLTMSSPHLHWHVIPVMETPTRPAEVLTWERGVLDGTAGEWDELVAMLEVKPGGS